MRTFRDARPGEVIVHTSPHFLQEIFERFRPILSPARRAGYDVGRVYLILDELLSNVYRHGYKEAAAQPIGVAVKVRGSRCHIRVRDLAPTFDSPLHARNRALPAPETGSPGGRGLVIVHRMCEVFTHRCGEEGGNELELVLIMLRRFGPESPTSMQETEPEDSPS